MPYVSLMDLISSCPAELEAGSIIVFDGCNWVLQQIPPGITCETLRECFDCEFFLDNFISFSGGLLVDTQACRVRVDMVYINQNIISNFDCNTFELTVGYHTMDLSCIAGLFTFSFTDGVTQDRVTNGETILVEGLHGLQMIVGANLIQVDLPSGATAGQVLTWNAINEVAYWANPLDICCDQIQACMSPIIAGLQAEINILSMLLCPCGGDGAQYPIAIYQDGILVVPQCTIIDFLSCFTITDIGLNHATIALNLGLSLDCNTYILSACDGSTVDFSCLAGATPPILVGRTAYVMKDYGDDGTGLVDRFDKPFKTIQAAINASAVSGQQYEVIVHPGNYDEIIELHNNVDVHFLKKTKVFGITTAHNGVVSKVTGYVVIQVQKTQPAGFAIYVKNNNCDIEVDCDKIHCTEQNERFAFIINDSTNSRLRVINGSIVTTDLGGLLTLIFTRGDGASTDAKTGVWNSPRRNTQFYYTGNRAELYWHDSYIVQKRTVNTPMAAQRNITEGDAKTYMSKLFIKGMWYGPSLETGRFLTDGNCITNVNEMIMDLYPEPNMGSKSRIFGSLNNGITNFYGMNVFRGNKSRDNLIVGGTNRPFNVYGRVVTDGLTTSLNINGSLINYGEFNGIKTRQMEQKVSVIPEMPFNAPFDNA